MISIQSIRQSSYKVLVTLEFLSGQNFWLKFPEISEISEISENFEISTKNISENAVVEDKGVPNVPKVADAVPEAIGSTIVPISTSTSSKNSDKSENSVISGNSKNSTENVSQKTSNVGGNEVTADLESAVASASTGNTSVPVKPTRVPLWRQIK